GATSILCIVNNRIQFQSTLPVWGATPMQNGMQMSRQVSIHAPRVGSDETLLPVVTEVFGFNPRSPCGERLRGMKRANPRWIVSIHAPRVGSDCLLRQTS